MENNFFSLKDVAGVAHTQAYKIHYWLANGMIPEPKIRVGGRRVWTLPEIVAVTERAQIDRNAQIERERRSDG